MGFEKILEFGDGEVLVLQQMALLPRKWGWEQGSWSHEQGGGFQALTIRDGMCTLQIAQIQACWPCFTAFKRSA